MLNLFMSATRTEVVNCITFFVAFHVLSMIDQIYLESLADIELMEQVCEKELEF
jgi:hypothetical protein